jgi:hypothetical protein
MELREVITGKSIEKAECIRSQGEPPVQMSNLDDFEANASVMTTDSTDDFFDEDDFHSDDYDEEELGDLSEGDPFESY